MSSSEDTRSSDSLSPSALRALEASAHKAGVTAQQTLALELLPFQDSPEHLRMVASWMLTLQDLQNFHNDHLGSSAKEYVTGLHVFKHLEGSVLGALDPQKAQSLKDFVLELARTFCGQRDSDEIHELMNLTWGCKVFTNRETQVFTHSKKRWSSSKNPAILSLLQPNRQRASQETALVIVEALGEHEAGLKEVYEKAYHQAYEAEKASTSPGGGVVRKIFKRRD